MRRHAKAANAGSTEDAGNGQSPAGRLRAHAKRSVLFLGGLVTMLLLSSGSASAKAEWSLQSMPSPKGSLTTLNGPSCTSSEACTAVAHHGSVSSQPLFAERWNGTEWSLQAMPEAPEALYSNLYAVSCATAEACVAVGEYVVESKKGVYDPKLFAEHWNGSKWSWQPMAMPAGMISGTPRGVSCVAANNCVAAGGYSTVGGESSLIERWNGTKWSLEAASEPVSSQGGRLDGISCRSAEACTAVGEFLQSGSGEMLPFAATWNGASWSAQLMAVPAGAVSSSVTVNSVSCGTSATCMAVGEYIVENEESAYEYIPLAESLGGGEWTVLSSPGPEGALYSNVYGVSCVSAEVCVTVGEHGTEAVAYSPFASTWNGAEWSAQALPQPPGESNSIAGVSCVSPEDCLAVGTYQEGSSTLPFAEQLG